MLQYGVDPNSVDSGHPLRGKPTKAHTSIAPSSLQEEAPGRGDRLQEKQGIRRRCRGVQQGVDRRLRVRAALPGQGPQAKLDTLGGPGVGFRK